MAGLVPAIRVFIGWRRQLERAGAVMSVYIIAQLKFTERERYDRYQARFFGVFRNFKGKLLVADEHPVVLEGEWPRDKVVIMEFPDAEAGAGISGVARV